MTDVLIITIIPVSLLVVGVYNLIKYHIQSNNEQDIISRLLILIHINNVEFIEFEENINNEYTIVIEKKIVGTIERQWGTYLRIDQSLAFTPKQRHLLKILKENKGYLYDLIENGEVKNNFK